MKFKIEERIIDIDITWWKNGDIIYTHTLEKYFEVKDNLLKRILRKFLNWKILLPTLKELK